MYNTNIKQVYYEAYLNQKVLELNQVENFTIKDRLEYDLFFYALWNSKILKDSNLQYSSLDLNSIEKSERPDFILTANNKQIGIEIKNKTSHENIMQRINEQIKKGISYEELVKFIQKYDTEKFIAKILPAENNKPITVLPKTLILDNSINDYIQFINEKIKNAYTYDKLDALFLVINFKDESYALNLLNDISFKYEEYLYYKNIEHSRLILKIY